MDILNLSLMADGLPGRFGRVRGGGKIPLRTLLLTSCVLFLGFLPVAAGAQNLPAVTNFKAGPGHQKFYLTWDKPSAETVVQYVIRWKNSARVNYPGENTRNINDGDATSYTLTGLNTLELYDVSIQYVVQPLNQPLQYSAFAYVKRIQAKAVTPGKVTGVSVAAPARGASGLGKLNVSWTAIIGVTGFDIGYRKSGDSWSTESVSGEDTTDYTITGLENDTDYTVRVRATNKHADDTTGEWSDQKTAKTNAGPPAKVGMPTVDPGVGTLTVSWSSVSDVTGYKVQWKSGSEDWSSSRQNTVTGTSATLTLTSGTTYTVRVIAYNPDGDGTPSQGRTGTPKAATPGKVSGVSVTPPSRGASNLGKLNVSWTAITGATGFHVQWKSGAQGWSTGRQNTINTGSATTDTITGLENDTDYTVRVRATNKHADDTTGAWSEESTGTTNAGPPGNTTIDSVTPDVRELDVSWSSVSDDVTTRYKVQWKSGEQNWSSGRENDETGTTSTISNLTSGTTYVVRVIAYNADGDGPASQTKTGIPKYVTPAQVTGVTIAEQAEQLSVSWSSVSGAENYVVQWKSGNEEFDSSRQNTVTDASSIITGLTAGTEHTVRVRATRRHADDGPWSEEEKGIPMHPQPGQVTGVSVTVGVRSLAVSWNAVTDASGYVVQWKSGNENWDETNRQNTVSSGSTTTSDITGLTAGTEYTVRVKAKRNNADDGPWSPEAKGRPNAPAATAVPPPGSDAGPAPPDSPDDTRCPDYPVGETAGGVERDRDPDTLVEFVQDALFGVKEILGEETEEREAVDRLVDCFGVDGVGVDGGWKSGSVYLFAITNERKYLLAPSGWGLDGTYLNLVDENGCDVAAELIRAASGEELQCKDLGLLPDGDAAGFVQYLWDNPSDPSDDSEPGYEERGEAPGNSPKLSYVEMITDEDILPGGFIVLVSGYYPDWDPGEEPAPPTGGPAPTDGDGGGGCGVAEVGSTSGVGVASLLLALLLLGFAKETASRSRDVLNGIGF